MTELADKIEALAENYRSPWRIETEPHDFPDGTAFFTHVRYLASTGDGAEVKVEVARHVTPELAELLCLLQNNLSLIVDALRKSTR